MLYFPGFSVQARLGWREEESVLFREAIARVPFFKNRPTEKLAFFVDVERKVHSSYFLLTAVWASRINLLS